MSKVKSKVKASKVRNDDKEDSGRDQYVLRGTLFWAHIKKPNAMSGQYQVNIKISKKDAAIMEDLGIDVKDELKVGKNEKGKQQSIDGFFVVAKSNFRPEIIDAKKRDLPEDMELGNGTEANVVVSPFEWTFKKKTGTSLNLDTIQVLELVEYARKSGRSLLDEAEGYEYEGSEEDSDDDDSDSEEEEDSDSEEDDSEEGDGAEDSEESAVKTKTKAKKKAKGPY